MALEYDETPTDELETESRRGSATALAEQPPLASGRRLGDRYTLERRLGHGGMAVVWLATDTRLGRPVAIKVLSETLACEHDYLGRFEREARIAAGLQHPNLVSVYDYDAGARPYLVMEYIEGGDLASLIEARRAPRAEELAAELLAALGHIHRAGVLHRDVKPQNVLVDGYGHARLTDFGIARPSGAGSLTVTGEVIGTKSYLAPEVLAGETASERSDLFGLGVLLADVAREGAGASVWKLIDQLRDPEPEGRPDSAAAALTQLERDEQRPPAGDPTRPYSIEPTATTAPAGPTPRNPGGAGQRFRPVAFRPTPVDVRERPSRERIVALGALGAVAVAAVVAVLLVGGGSDGSGSGGSPKAATASKSRGGNAGGSAAAGGGNAPSLLDDLVVVHIHSRRPRGAARCARWRHG